MGEPSKKKKMGIKAILFAELIVLVLFFAGGSILVDRRFGMKLQATLDANAMTIYATTAQIASALFGFVVTGISIALVIAQDPKFEEFRKSSHYVSLWAIFRAATWPLGILAVIALIDMFMAGYRFFFYVTAFFVVLSVLRLVCVVRTLYAMTETLANITVAIEDHNDRLRRDLEE